MKKIRYIPYGYTMRNGRTVISSEEAEVIREIFKAYLGGASLKSIAEELTARQIPYTQKTATWDKARIARIINNAKYVGTEEYDPIIDEDMYEAAVSLKTARQRNTCKKENDAIALLRDLVRCDCCGHPKKRQVSTKHRIRESWNAATEFASAMPSFWRPLRSLSTGSFSITICSSPNLENDMSRMPWSLKLEMRLRWSWNRTIRTKILSYKGPSRWHRSSMNRAVPNSTLQCLLQGNWRKRWLLRRSLIRITLPPSLPMSPLEHRAGSYFILKQKRRLR